MARLAARIGLDAGVDPDSGDFSDEMEKALTDARGKLPKTVEEVEAQSGLRKLGLTAEELIEAIRRPWGDTARKVQAALDNQADVLENMADNASGATENMLENRADALENRAEATRDAGDNAADAVSGGSGPNR